MRLIENSEKRRRTARGKEERGERGGKGGNSQSPGMSWGSGHLETRKKVHKIK